MGFMEESVLIHRSGLAGGRGQEGVTCSRRLASDDAQKCIPSLSLPQQGLSVQALTDYVLK